MSEYTLSNTALDIDSAITRVVKADIKPKAGSQNMVTSGGVASAIDDIGTGSNAVITVDSFTETSLQDSNDGLTSTDTAIPTSKAVKDYVDNNSPIGSLTEITAGTHTAATDLFITVTSAAVKGQQQQPVKRAIAKITIDSVEFTIQPPTTTDKNSISSTSSSFFVKKGETYILHLPTATSGMTSFTATAHFRTFPFTP